MDWPPPFPPVLSAGTASVRPYRQADVAELFTALADERAWEHIPRAIPASAAELDQSITAKLADGNRVTFTIRDDGRVVGLTSVLFDPGDPAGAEVGGTQLDPAVWGSGVNPAVIFSVSRLPSPLTDSGSRPGLLLRLAAGRVTGRLQRASHLERSTAGARPAGADVSAAAV